MVNVKVNLQFVKKQHNYGLNPGFVKGYVSMVLKNLQPLYISQFRQP